MVVMITSNSKSKLLLEQLEKDYPQLSFKAGKTEHWSPKSKTVTYNQDQPLKFFSYGLLHEMSHALLHHDNYQTDFELLKLEAQAWELAAEIGQKYAISIDPEHIQNCLDTYRDWLHKRSECPKCGTHSLQQNATTYSCFNCQHQWQVSSGRFVRPYRRHTSV